MRMQRLAPIWGRGIALSLLLTAPLLLLILPTSRDEVVSASPRQLAAPAPVIAPLSAVQSDGAPPPVRALAPLPSTIVPSTAPFLPAIASPGKEPSEVRTYQGRTYRYVKTLTLRVTAYAADPRCTYPYSGTTTASGLPVTTNGGRLVAADTSVIPLHALVVVPGYASGSAVPVLDRGGAIKGNRLDVLLPSYARARDWGVRMLQVKVYEAAGK